jgi:hypothetical protein
LSAQKNHTNEISHTNKNIVRKEEREERGREEEREGGRKEKFGELEGDACTYISLHSAVMQCVVCCVVQ